MSSLILAEIIFDDSSESIKLNKRLIQYFKNNIDELNKNKIKCIFKIAHDDEIEFYEEKGIKNFPALILDDNIKKYGIESIINALVKIGSQNKQKIVSSAKPTSYEAWATQLMDPKKEAGDEDPEADRESALQRRIVEMSQRRDKAGLPPIHSKTNAQGEPISGSVIDSSPAQDPDMRNPQMGRKSNTMDNDLLASWMQNNYNPNADPTDNYLDGDSTSSININMDDEDIYRQDNI